ncbi:hypothetical protein QLX08_004870 [Tetragonisca angustula]|uniref:Uncharacterized protein n=1 Tax=Tetragonisca angustula TaxID=166442 RepID=A0AAW1A0T9_9HYME
MEQVAVDTKRSKAPPTVSTAEFTTTTSAIRVKYPARTEPRCSPEESIDLERPMAGLRLSLCVEINRGREWNTNRACSPIFDVPFIPDDLMKSPVHKIQKVKAYSAGS